MISSPRRGWAHAAQNCQSERDGVTDFPFIEPHLLPPPRQSLEMLMALLRRLHLRSWIRLPVGDAAEVVFRHTPVDPAAGPRGDPEPPPPPEREPPRPPPPRAVDRGPGGGGASPAALMAPPTICDGCAFPPRSMLDTSDFSGVQEPPLGVRKHFDVPTLFLLFPKTATASSRQCFR